jgi:hypothetical protein
MLKTDSTIIASKYPTLIAQWIARTGKRRNILRLFVEGLAEAPPNDSAQPKINGANDKTENVAFLPPPDFRSILRNEYDLKFALTLMIQLSLTSKHAVI